MHLTPHIDDVSDEELMDRKFEAKMLFTVTRRYLFDLMPDGYCEPETGQLCTACRAASVSGTLLVIGEETGNAAVSSA